MYTKLALVGAAALGAQMAAATCALGVEISNVDGHNVDVTITNTANHALSVFKGNTVLSGHATKNVDVTDSAGSAVPFSGRYFNYNRKRLSPGIMETIPAGGSVTKTVNVASTHDLAGVDSVNVAAIQGFYYQPAYGNATSAYDLESCESISNEVKLSVDQTAAKRDHISSRSQPRSRIQRRSITYSSCSTSRTSTLKTAFSDAVTMSNNAATAAASSEDDYLTWFKSTSVLSTVKKIYNDVAGVQSTGPTVYCTDFDDGCSDSVIAYTEPSSNQMSICPDGGFWGFPMEASDCADSDYDQAGTVLHESTHLYGTDDYAYGESSSTALSASKASENADTYELYAASVRLGGCT